jgi:hypothetical protein
MYQEGAEFLLSAIECMKDNLEEIAPFIMGGREMTRAAANSKASAKFQRGEVQETRQKHKRHARISNNQVGHVPFKRVKSHELKGGVLYSKCDCTKRNGLQSDCGRFLCMGRPECVTNPPMCLPSGGLGYISPC